MQARRTSQPHLPVSPEWPTLVVAAGIWAVFVGTLLTHDRFAWWVTVPALAVVSGAYASLQHEVAHGHPTPWRSLNLLVAGAPLGVVYPFARFRDLHLAHHADPSRLTEPGFDTESRYCSPEAWQQAGALGRLCLRAERTLVGFLTIGVVRGAIVYIARDLRSAVRDRALAVVWVRHIAALGVLGLVLAATGLPWWQYLVGVVYGRLVFTGLRLFAEHRAVEGATKSAVVHAGPFLSLVFLNNNLHHTHHAAPAAAWYRLPALHDDLGSDQLAAGGAGLYRGGYVEVARRFGIRPFCQPVWPNSEKVSHTRSVTPSSAD